MSFLRHLFPRNSWVRKIWYFLKAFFAALWYRFPARKLKIIGITGTDGKTSTVEMVSHILREADVSHLQVSTVSIFFNGKHLPNVTKRTTLSPWKMQRLLRQAADQKTEVAVLEISSHATEQKRIFGIQFDIAGVTNVTEGHVKDHGSFQAYTYAKKLVFTSYLKPSGTAVLNYDDKVIREWKKDIAAHIIWYTPDSQPRQIELTALGDFQKKNAALAFEMMKAFGISEGTIRSALQKFTGVTGRLEKVDCDQNFDIYIDFAVTTNALKNLLESARKLTDNHLWIVFGCYGDVDTKRRSEMGKVAGDVADYVVLTDDEPYTESADSIRRQVKEGVMETKAWNDGDDSPHFWEIPDRKNAIEFALQSAKPGDTVVISGLGCEESRNIGGKEIKWSDKKIVTDILNIRKVHQQAEQKIVQEDLKGLKEKVQQQKE
jgi:UDP-N-acetylmuramoyl-L-alanyl-D-glutamate--2,6-diaminopimelate ligase